MNYRQIFSRRPAAEKVDFRPDTDARSPFAQVCRLEVYLDHRDIGADDITDCPDALNAFREYTYRKIFTNTTHAEFVTLDRTEPKVIDWLIAVHEVASAHFQPRRK